jgi:hypothetical protein
MQSGYLLIPLTLFVCGGDLGWWQAWLYSLLIVTAGSYADKVSFHIE